MKTIQCLLAVLLAVFVAGQARAAIILTEGSPVLGPTSLLGFDASLNDYVSGGVSSVNDQNIEFLTDDFALGIDFESDGLVRLWDNLGTGDDLFNYTLRFSLPSLGGPIRDIQFRDVTGLAGGDLLFSLIDANTFELSLTNVQFTPGFSHADVGLSVDEPSTLALLALGMFGVYAARRRRSGLAQGAEVAP